MASFTIGGSWDYTTDDHFNVSAPTSSTIDAVTLNIGQTLCTQLNFSTNGTTAMSIDGSQNFSFNMNNITWNVSGFFEVIAVNGFVFASTGASTNVIFSAPMISLNGADIELNPTSALTMGAVTATNFIFGSLILINCGSSGTITIDAQTSPGTINIANANTATMQIGNNSCYTTMNASSLTINTTGGAVYQDAVSLSVDSVTLNIGASLCTSMNIGNSGYSLTISGSSIAMPNVPGSAPGGSVALLYDPSTGLIYHA